MIENNSKQMIEYNDDVVKSLKTCEVFKKHVVVFN